MAIIGAITLDNGVSMVTVDVDPSTGGGLDLAPGSIALLQGGSGIWQKGTGGFTDWTVSDATSAISDVAYGVGWNGDTTHAPSKNAVYDKIEALDAAKLNLIGGTMSGSILFTGGAGIDTTATGGSDVLNIGTTNADIINIGRSGITVNIIGTTVYENVTNLEVTDKLITLNKGGSALTATSSGIEFEEGGVITGYITTNGTRNGYSLLSPAIAFEAQFLMSSLTANRVYTLPDATGTLALTSDLSAYVQKITGNVEFYFATNNVSITPYLTSWTTYLDLQDGRIQLVTPNGGIDLYSTSGSMYLYSLGAGNSVLVTSKGDLYFESGVGYEVKISSEDGNNGYALLNTVNLTSDKTFTFPDVTGTLALTSDIAASISDTAFAVSWDGVTTIAPSKNAVYDEMITKVAGPASATDTAIALYDGTTGKLIKNSSVLIDGSSNISGLANVSLSGQLIMSNFSVKRATVNTTDNIATTIDTISIATDTTVMIEARVAGRRTGGSAGASGDSATYIRYVKAKNIAGTVTIGTIQTEFTTEDQAAWNATFVVSGTNVDVQVQGAINNNVTWNSVTTTTTV